MQQDANDKKLVAFDIDAEKGFISTTYAYPSGGKVSVQYRMNDDRPSSYDTHFVTIEEGYGGGRLDIRSMTTSDPEISMDFVEGNNKLALFARNLGRGMLYLQKLSPNLQESDVFKKSKLPPPTLS